MRLSWFLHTGAWANAIDSLVTRDTTAKTAVQDLDLKVSFVSSGNFWRTITVNLELTGQTTKNQDQGYIEARCNILRSTLADSDKSASNVFSRLRPAPGWPRELIQSACNDAESTTTWIFGDDPRCTRNETRWTCEWTITSFPSWNHELTLECAVRMFDDNTVAGHKMITQKLPRRSLISWRTWITNDRRQYKIGTAELEFALEDQEALTCYFHPVLGEGTVANPNPNPNPNMPMAIVASNFSLIINASEFAFDANSSRYHCSKSFQWPEAELSVDIPSVPELLVDRKAVMQCTSSKSSSVLMGDVTFSNYLNGSCLCGCSALTSVGLNCSCAPSCEDHGDCCADYFQYCSNHTQTTQFSCAGRLHQMHIRNLSASVASGETARWPALNSSIPACNCQRRPENGTVEFHCEDYARELDEELAYKEESLLLPLCSGTECGQDAECVSYAGLDCRTNESCVCTRNDSLLFWRDDCTGPRVLNSTKKGGQCGKLPPTCSVSLLQPSSTCSCSQSPEAAPVVNTELDSLPWAVPSLEFSHFSEPHCETTSTSVLESDEILIQVSPEDAAFRCKICDVKNTSWCYPVMPMPVNRTGAYALKLRTEDRPREVFPLCRSDRQDLTDRQNTYWTPGFLMPIEEVSAASPTIRILIHTANDEPGVCTFTTDSEDLSQRFAGPGSISISDVSFEPGTDIKVRCRTRSGIVSDELNITLSTAEETNTVTVKPTSLQTTSTASKLIMTTMECKFELKNKTAKGPITMRSTNFSSIMHAACPENAICEQTARKAFLDVVIVEMVVKHTQNENQIEHVLTSIKEQMRQAATFDAVDITCVTLPNLRWWDTPNLIYGLISGAFICCMMLGILLLARKRTQYITYNDEESKTRNSKFIQWSYDSASENHYDLEAPLVLRGVKIDDASLTWDSHAQHVVSDSVEDSDTGQYPSDGWNDTPKPQHMTFEMGDHFESPNDWFYFDEKQNVEVGPFSINQMRMWFHHGSLQKTANVRQGVSVDKPVPLFAPITDWYPGYNRADAFETEPRRIPRNLARVTDLTTSSKTGPKCSSDAWFYWDDQGRKVGPLNKKNLQEWLACDQIRAGTLLYSIDGTGRRVQEVLSGQVDSIRWEYTDDMRSSFTTEEMRTRYRDGRLTSNSLVRNDLMKQLVPLQSVFSDLHDVFEQSDDELLAAHSMRTTESSYRGMEFGPSNRSAQGERVDLGAGNYSRANDDGRYSMADTEFISTLVGKTLSVILEVASVFSIDNSESDPEPRKSKVGASIQAPISAEVCATQVVPPKHELTDVGESANDWYYFDEKHDVEIGPFTLEQMRLCFSTKKLLGEEFNAAAKVRHGGESEFAPICDWYPHSQPFVVEHQTVSNMQSETASSEHGGAHSSDSKAGPEVPEWFYKDDQSGCTVGPLTEGQMMCWSDLGQIDKATIVWNTRIPANSRFQDAFYKRGKVQDWLWNFVGTKATKEGPYSTERMLTEMRLGNVTAGSWVKSETMDTWATLQEVFPQIDEAFLPEETRMTNFSQWQSAAGNYCNDLPGRIRFPSHVSTEERRRTDAARRKQMREKIYRKYNIKIAVPDIEGTPTSRERPGESIARAYPEVKKSSSSRTATPWRERVAWNPNPEQRSISCPRRPDEGPTKGPNELQSTPGVVKPGTSDCQTKMPGARSASCGRVRPPSLPRVRAGSNFQSKSGARQLDSAPNRGDRAPNRDGTRLAGMQSKLQERVKDATVSASRQVEPRSASRMRARMVPLL